MTRLEQIRADRISREYRELRASNHDAFTACVRAAEAIMLNHDKSLRGLTEGERLRLGADIEAALVSVACGGGK